MEYATLNTGAKMPLEGFGVFHIPDEEESYDTEALPDTASIFWAGRKASTETERWWARFRVSGS